MITETHDFLPLAEALAELNKDILGKDSGAACYAASTAYARAATGAIPVQKFGRTYFVRRADIPLIASRLPLGVRRLSHSTAQKKPSPAREFWIVGGLVFSDEKEARRIHTTAMHRSEIIRVREVLPGEGA